MFLAKISQYAYIKTCGARMHNLIRNFSVLHGSRNSNNNHDNSSKSEEISKLDIKLPLRYQKDVTQENLHEIFQMFRDDPTYPNNNYNSEAILRAMTAIADRPWWTCRDATEKILAFFMISRDVANRFSVANTLYVKPEARGGYGIGVNLYSLTYEAMIEKPSTYFRGWFSPGGDKIANIVQRLYTNEEKDYMVRHGIPRYDPALLKDRIREDIHIVPYSQKLSFSDLVTWDEFVTWDTTRIYGAPRPAFWDVLLNAPSVNAYLAIDKLTRQIVGFGVIQPSFNEDCMVIGPVYGEDENIALTLMKKLFDHYETGQKIMITHYVSNQTMKDFFESIDIPEFMHCPLLTTEPDSFPTELTKRMFLSPSNSACAQ